MARPWLVSAFGTLGALGVLGAFGALGAFASVTACHGGGDAVVVHPGAVAGTVVEIANVVTATRDGKTRTLAQGDAVTEDDVIDTGDTGSVTIEFAHNRVRWALERHNHKRVVDSVAWTAPRDEHEVATVAPISGAAGRNAERSAAEGAPSGRVATDSSAPSAAGSPSPSAVAGVTAPSSGSAAVPLPLPTPLPPAAVDGIVTNRPTPPSDRPTPPSAKPLPPPTIVAPHAVPHAAVSGSSGPGAAGPGEIGGLGLHGEGGGGAGDGGGGGGGLRRGPSPTIQPSQPSKNIQPSPKNDQVVMPSSSDADAPSSSPPPPPPRPPMTPANRVSAVYAMHKAEVAACMPAGAAHAHLMLSLHVVDGAGRMSISDWGALGDGAVRACIQKALAAISWPSLETALTIDL